MSIDSVNAMLEKGIKQEGLSVRGMRLVGKVVSTKMKKTVVVQREIVKYLKKYKRWYRDNAKIHAHVPSNIELNVGDIVEVAQTRRISKTKAWVVTKLIKTNEKEVSA